MSVLTRRGQRTVGNLGHIATWLDKWQGLPSGFANMVDPQLRKLAVFDTRRHPNGRKTQLHSASDQKMSSIGFEPTVETNGIRYKEGSCEIYRSRVEPSVLATLCRVKKRQTKSGPCVLCRVQRVKNSYVPGSWKLGEAVNRDR